MYAEFFGLRELPFNNTPDPRFFYSTPDHEEALASLVYAVKERKGFVLLTGEVGAGKTLVSRLMIKHFGGTIAFANINHAIRGPADLMESLCAEFELPHGKGASNTQLVRVLHDFLLERFAQNVPVVLVLDEAQNLPVEAFEQLRMIGNLEADDAKLLQIAIVGQPELQTLFNSNALRQLRQRLFRSFHLPALDRKTVEGYIRHRLVVAGGDGKLFDAPAIDSIHRASRGLPRLINTLCDNIMLSAYSADRKTIDAAFVESVVAAVIVPEGLTSTVAKVSTPGPMEVVRERAAAAAVVTSQKMDAAAAHAAQILGRVESSVDRAKLIYEQLAVRQQQIERLHAMVQTSAARLAPLLEQLTRASRRCTESTGQAEAISRELDAGTQRAGRVLEQVTNTLHQARLAQLKDTAHSAPDGRARKADLPISVAFAGPAEPPQKVQVQEPAGWSPPREAAPPSHPSPARPASVLQAAAMDRKVIIPEKTEEPFQDQEHPALRLARRMEHLAELVEQAVSACTPR